MVRVRVFLEAWLTSLAPDDDMPTRHALTESMMYPGNQGPGVSPARVVLRSWRLLPISQNLGKACQVRPVFTEADEKGGQALRDSRHCSGQGSVMGVSGVAGVAIIGSLLPWEGEGLDAGAR